MKYSKDKRINEVTEQVIAQGWAIERGTRHWVLIPPDKQHPKITVPGTPSDHRAAKNFIAQVRRAGGVVN